MGRDGSECQGHQSPEGAAACHCLIRNWLHVAAQQQNVSAASSIIDGLINSKLQLLSLSNPKALLACMIPMDLRHAQCTCQI